jgi:hypothetical protein
MYGLAKIGASPVDGTVPIATPQSCAFVVEVLRAGQWQVTTTVTRDGAQHSWYQGMVRMGPRMGVFHASQTPSGCTGVITVDQPVTMTLSGAVTASGTGRSLSIWCFGGYDDDDKTMPSHPDKYAFLALYQIAGHSYLAHGMIRNSKGSRSFSLTATDSASDDESDTTDSVYVVSVPDDIPEPAGALAVFQQMQGVDSTPSALHGSNPARWPSYIGGSHATESVTVTHTDPLVATVTARGMHDENHPQHAALSFTLPLTCVA